MLDKVAECSRGRNCQIDMDGSGVSDFFNLRTRQVEPSGGMERGEQREERGEGLREERREQGREEEEKLDSLANIRRKLPLFPITPLELSSIHWEIRLERSIKRTRCSWSHA